MAEWLGRALQKLVQRFESASDLFQMIPRQRDFFCLLLQAELAQSRKEQAKKSLPQEGSFGSLRPHLPDPLATEK